MDSNFAIAFKAVLNSEGGWSDDPRDPGGATMKGITLENFRRFVKPNATKKDLHNITNEQLATVYRRQYWEKVAGSQLPNGIDYAVFDFGVNSGPSRAARYLQKMVGAKADGMIGPATLAAIKSKKPEDVINALCDARLAFLKRLDTWPHFSAGWTARVNAVRRTALAMARGKQ